MKSDVEKSLVPKEETIIQVELTTIQKKYYRAIFEKNINMLKSGKGTVPSLLNIALQLRKCCSHPYLISNAIEEELVGSLQESQDIMTSTFFFNHFYNYFNIIFFLRIGRMFW